MMSPSSTETKSGDEIGPMLLYAIIVTIIAGF